MPDHIPQGCFPVRRRGPEDTPTRCRSCVKPCHSLFFTVACLATSEGAALSALLIKSASGADKSREGTPQENIYMEGEQQVIRVMIRLKNAAKSRKFLIASGCQISAWV